MTSALRRLTAACCVAVLLAAGAWTAASLRAPDPRARGAWGAPPITVGASPVTVNLYLPGCATTALVVHAQGPASGALHAEAWRSGPDGAMTPLATGVRARFDDRGEARVPLTAPPTRERIQLRLAVDGPPHTLDTAQPFSVDTSTASSFGVLSCALDGHVGQTTALLATVAMGLAVIGWLAAALIAGGPWRVIAHPRVGPLLAAGVAVATVITYLLVVPPFEPADELAHYQYARYVATTASLPDAAPAPDSEWHDSAYEWVQQPAYYVLAAAVLHVAGDPSAAPAPTAHPQSRLSGGPDVSIYRHPDATSPPEALRLLWVLRWLSVVMAAATVYCAARAVAIATGNGPLGTMAAASLALVPQWCAVMGIVSTDPPATLAAAVATLLMCHAVRTPDGRRFALIGLVTGLAYAVKATAVMLVPMAAVTWLAAARQVERRRWLALAGWLGAGVLLTAAWVPLRAWIVFGDPLARAFKREVLTAGGFTLVEGPPVLSAAFADQMRTMVFESFWARFGSLGAGPLPGTRLWWIYAAVTLALIASLLLGTLATLWAWRREPGTRRPWMLAVSLVGVATGLALWAWVNLVPQADMIVHWTPRHILPLTAPLLVVTAWGLQALASALPPLARRALQASLGVGLLVLAGASLAVLRSVILNFHFGY